MTSTGLRLEFRRLFFVAVYAPCRSIAGRLAFARRSYDVARSHFERILDVHPDHFAAHVFLARIHLLDDEEREAIRELHEARRIDPVRFERLGLEAEFLEAAEPLSDESDETLLDEGLIPTAWPEGEGSVAPRSAADARGETNARSSRASRRRRISHPRRDPLSVGTPSGFGDFSGPEEAARFRHLPPLRREDIDGVDWEGLDSRVFD